MSIGRTFIFILGLLTVIYADKDGDVCKMPSKYINTAFLTIQIQDNSNSDNVTLTVKAVTAECYTTFHIRYYSVYSENELSQSFKEGGNYSLYVNLNHNGDVTCHRILLLNSPMDNNIPIFVAMAVFCALAIAWYLLKKMYRYRANILQSIQHYLRPSTVPTGDSSKLTAQDLGLPVNTTNDDIHKPRKERLKSLDTFRGISIIVMIFVNYKGGNYWFFQHSKWNGLTVADLVFPWFVWIMGTSMAYSFQAQLRRATPKKEMFWKIFKRSCILFALGLLINSSDGSDPAMMTSFRIPGVLQRFGGTYLITATLHMFFAKPNDPNQYKRLNYFRDITNYWQEWIFNIILAIVWLSLTFGLYVPGCPRGYLGPGGLANDSTGANVSVCTGGAAAYIDRVIFGESHIYQTPTCKEVYQTTVPHDPEGLLGFLTSCIMCFLGLQAGKILLTFPDWITRIKRFVIWGVALGVVAVILCEGQKNDGFIPINKNLWSLSFVLCLSCFAFFLFAFCYVMIDVYQLWSGAPFYYPGMNSISMYVGHLVFQPYFPVSFYVNPTSHWAQLAMNLWGPSFWCLFTYKMYLDKIFITI